MHLFCMAEEDTNILCIRLLKHNRGCSQSSRSLASEVRSGLRGVNSVRSTRGGHLLRPLPAGMIGVSVTDPCVQDVGLSVGLEEVVRAPSDSRLSIAELLVGR